MAKKIIDESKRFEKSGKPGAGVRYILRLYITGMTSRSVRAVENVKHLCEEHLHGRYDLEVIDIYRRPEIVQGEQLIAAPTLIKKSPLPLKKFIGDMSSTEKLLRGLDLATGVTLLS